MRAGCLLDWGDRGCPQMSAICVRSGGCTRIRGLAFREMRFWVYMLHSRPYGWFRSHCPLNHPPAAPVDGARVLTAERHHVAPPAVRLLGVEVRQRLPAATETDDLDIVLAAAVGDGFYDRVEAWTSPPPLRMPIRFFAIATP